LPIIRFGSVQRLGDQEFTLGLARRLDADAVIPEL
jgi:hypothetical protein